MKVVLLPNGYLGSGESAGHSVVNFPSMFSSLQKLVAWLLIVLLALVAGVGEGLHALPGCGHAVRVGQVTVLLGVSFPDCQLAVDNRSPTDEGSAAHRPDEGPDIPVYDEDQCPICSTVGKACTATDAPQFTLAVPLVQCSAVVISEDVYGARGRLFQARAPPLV